MKLVRGWMVAAAGMVLVVGGAIAGLDREPDPLLDAYRPVTRITDDGFTLQWYTAQPAPTRIMLRQGDVSMAAWQPKAVRSDPWADAQIIDGDPGERTFHHLTVDGLEPGKRYFYRIYDPFVEPDGFQRRYGAAAPWGREYAVATRAGEGRRTLIRLPVKVLLMPNVVNVATAHVDGQVIPPPPKMTDEQIELVKAEYQDAARFLFVNSGLRLWVDFEFFVDDRWQRWGDEPEGVDAAYADWPISRSYSGVDYRFPGGGTFTILDTEDIESPTTQPVFEQRPYAGQVEQAFLRQWDAEKGEWILRNSGGGTYGPDRFNEGFPGRSQYLGGNDIAWTTTHEFHHQMEGLSRVSFPHSEHDRIVFNHPEVRRRVIDNGKPRTNAWTAAGRHGGHWDVMAFWDRTLTDTQWLRVYLGEAVAVVDADNDGVPDDDPRLPLDEKRFGSDPSNPTTDGVHNDRDKIMFATWAPAPLQPTFIKPRDQLRTPDPTSPDSDGDGVPDGDDPYPLDPYPPFVWPMTATVDGNPAEWAHVPAAGVLDRFAGEDGPERLHLTFKQAHDKDAYFGMIVLDGPWRELNVILDGEGEGIFNPMGVVEFNLRRDGAGQVTLDQVKRAAGLQWQAGESGDGGAIIEFSIPNDGESPWFWAGAGREIGAAFVLTDQQRRLYSVYEPYRLFYARMLAK